MKKFSSILGLFLFTTSLFGQTKIDSLIQQGVYLHDAGQYDKAIEIYKQALAIDPNSDIANYEISFSYMSAKDYENSIKHSNKVIELNKDYVLQAYLTKGSSLDYLGKTNESIKLFEKGLKKFGDNYLLYYNLGYDYYKIKNYDKAEEAFANAIKTNPNHASSHLILAQLMADLNKNVQSLLCLNYFLLLEPNTERSKTAFRLLEKQFGGNVEKDKEKPNQINILIGADQMDSEFGPANLMISMLQASNYTEENKGKSEDQLFIENTKSFFNILGELKKDKNKGLWWNFYVPFFNDLANSDHIETYCYYITQSSKDKSIEWLKNNNPKIVLFDQWLKEKQNGI
jgi:tetratricopeptide (TPR) repeat protein